MGNTRDLSNRINESYSRLSKGQKLLATYITDNYDKAVFLTAARLGEVVGVSESTVVAERIGLAISAVSSYESNNRYPSYEVLIKLARIFHVSTDYLLGITNKRNIDVTGLDEEEIELLSQIADKFRRNH